MDLNNLNFNTINQFNNLEESFKTSASDNTQELAKKKVIVLINQTGKRKNTYIIYWNISDEEKKKHIKVLKNKCACGGSVKDIEYDNVQENVLHLQGSHEETVKMHLFENNVTDIIVK